MNEMPEKEISQLDIDNSYKKIKETWDEMVKKSGFSEAVYIAIGKDSVVFLTDFHDFREFVLKKGFSMPELVPNLTLKFS